MNAVPPPVISSKKETTEKKVLKILAIVVSFPVGLLVLLIVIGLLLPPSEKSVAPQPSKSYVEKHKGEIHYVAADFIKKRLKAPSTAKVQSSLDSKVVELDNGNVQVVLWVEAQNSFGTPLRNTYLVEMEPAGSETWRLVDLVVLK